MLQLLKNLLFVRASKTRESEVLHISARIQAVLGVDDVRDIPYCQTFPCGEYVVIRDTRYFSDGWHDTLEISTKECHHPGYPYKGNHNPYWITELDGSRAINLPPKKVVEKVIYYLQNN